LKVFWEDEIGGAGDYELIPVACLEREMDDIKLSRRFVPPSVSVSSSGVLAQTMKNIREQVTARCRMLEEYKVPREAQSSDYGIRLCDISFGPPFFEPVCPVAPSRHGGARRPPLVRLRITQATRWANLAHSPTGRRPWQITGRIILVAGLRPLRYRRLF